MPTPKPAPDTLMAALGHVFNTQIAADLQDPETWAEIGVDPEKFAVGLERHGVRIDISLTFSKPTDTMDATVEPMQVGITGDDPEHFLASVSMEGTEFRG